MNRFEQLIEYVINDEEAKARELFHDIVVAKSREIYESLMQEEAEEDLDESAEEELDEAAEEDLDESAEEEELDEGMMDEMGGDAADDLIDNVEADESQDMNMEDMDMGMDADSDMHDDEEPATKSDVMNLEDKLDQLMAEFEDLMGDKDMGDGDDFGPEEGGDAIEMDDTEEMDDEEMEGMGMMEAVSLKAAPKPVTSEEGSVNKRGSNNNNGGANSPISKAVKPVHIGQGDQDMGKHDAPGAYSNQTKDLISDFQNKAGASMKGTKPATKPHLAQATGVNTKSPVARG